MTIPKRLHSTIHTFCSDMWHGYLGAIADFIAAHPDVKAKIVIDRFHVAQNYRDDFDTLRKKEMRRLRQELPEATYKDVAHGMHWVLRHNHKFLKTLRNHLDEIANYFDKRASSGFVEGFNNKLKITTRRSYGLKRVDSLFRRLWLDLNGYRQFIA